MPDSWSVTASRGSSAQGFPKNKNLGQRAGTALKPAHEPIALAWKPFKGTISGNVAQFGTGALNIDACRIDRG
jgi:site-specific DNA-methyltransferase (adenine-specific)